MPASEGHYQPRAGWYPDVEQPYARRRYWDGERWTDRFQEIEGHHLRHPEDPPQALGVAKALAIGGLLVIAVIEAFNIVADLNYIGVANAILDGAPPPRGERLDAIDLVEAGGWALLVGYLLIGPLTFIPWFARAYSNLPRLGILPLRYKPGWAIGAWFIPIFNLIRPKQIANDIYRGSRPDAPAGREFSSLPVSPLVHWWWALFLIAGFAGQAGGRILQDAAEQPAFGAQSAIDLIEQERLGLIITASSSVLAIVAAAVAVRMVLRLSNMQSTAIEKVIAADRGVAEQPPPPR